MKNLTRLDKYVITPNVGFYGGFKYDGEDIHLCNDHDVDEGYDFQVEQHIKDDVLVTDIKREYTLENGRKVKETSHMEVTVEEGQLIVYVEGLGFTIPEHGMCTVKEASELYQLLEVENGNDIKGNETEDTQTD